MKFKLGFLFGFVSSVVSLILAGAAVGYGRELERTDNARQTTPSI
jgi:hypothetical protein